jgi:hypothetical protein
VEKEKGVPVAGHLSFISSLGKKVTRYVLENTGTVPLDDSVLVYPEFTGLRVHPVAHDVRTLDPGSRRNELASGRPAGSIASSRTARELSHGVAQRLADAVLQKVERKHEAYFIGRLAAAPAGVDVAPARVRAQAAVVLARLPVVFQNVVPFGAATAIQKVRSVDRGTPPGTVARAAETRFVLPRDAGAGRTPAKVFLRIHAPRSLSKGELALSVRACEGDALVPLELGGEEPHAPGEHAARSSAVELRVPAIEIVHPRERSITFLQEFQRPANVPDEGYVAGLQVEVVYE